MFNFMKLIAACRVFLKIKNTNLQRYGHLLCPSSGKKRIVNDA